MKITSSKHLPAIDGLRAVAVLAVVLYHANVPGFSGGYLGVDIFFVISGYLITGLLHHEGQHTGRIDFIAFYARRFRRLLPALAVVLTVTLIAAWWILFPAELPRLGKAATAVVLMFSNLHFRQYSGGYFDPSVDVMPLLHTWSLSVEEQFYLFWPLLLLACLTLARKFHWQTHRLLAGILTASILASFAYWLAHLGSDPNTAFYVMPARTWELALGGLINFLPGAARHQRAPSPAVSTLSSVSMVVVIMALILPLDPEQYTALRYPITILATGGLIYAIHCHSSSRLVKALLQNKPAIHLGLTSYSFYLWHWPLLALGRAYYLGERLLPRDLALVLIALGLAFASYRLVETPIRRKHPWPFSSDKTTLKAAVAITLALLALAHWVKESGQHQHDRDNQTLQDKQALWGGQRLTLAVDKCDEPTDGMQLAPRQNCLRGPKDAPVRTVVWGDSHAGHLEGMFFPRTEKYPQQYLMRAFGACPPLLDTAPLKGQTVQTGCAQRNRLIMDEIRELAAKDLKAVVLGGRWNLYLSLPETNPASTTSYALVDTHAENAQSLKAGRAPADHPGSLRQLETGLRKTLESLADLGVQVLLIAPIPEPYFNVPHCLYRKSENECRFSRQRVDERRKDTLKVLQAASSGLPNVHLIDFIGYFCDNTTCQAKHGDFPVYWDYAHMTPEMANYLGDMTEKELGWLWKASPRNP